jgi:hypothetical protein
VSVAVLGVASIITAASPFSDAVAKVIAVSPE